MVTDEILCIDPKRYKNNADLIAYGVAPMGYLDGAVMDLTYGKGTFWKKWAPWTLAKNDIDPDKGVMTCDFRAMPYRDDSFDAVVFDPPYKLQGTPSNPEMDERFGTVVYKTLNAVELLHVEGSLEAVRLSRRYVLVKTMSQVSGGCVRWLPDLVSQTMLGRARKVTQFFLVGHRAQPKKNPDGSERAQKTPRNNYSTLLVFEVEK